MYTELLFRPLDSKMFHFCFIGSATVSLLIINGSALYDEEMRNDLLSGVKDGRRTWFKSIFTLKSSFKESIHVLATVFLCREMEIKCILNL